MTIKPARVVTYGRDPSWGFRVLGPNSEVLASRWGFRTDHQARQAGIAASLAMTSSLIASDSDRNRISRDLLKGGPSA